MRGSTPSWNGTIQRLHRFERAGVFGIISLRCLVALKETFDATNTWARYRSEMMVSSISY